MSKNQLRSSGKHRRCGFANGAGELRLLFNISLQSADGFFLKH